MTYPRAGLLVNSFNLNFGGGQCVTGCNGLVIWSVSNALWVSGTPGVQVTGVVIPTANTYFLPPNALRNPGAAGTTPCARSTRATRAYLER